jgi:predicted Zn-dependent protease
MGRQIHQAIVSSFRVYSEPRVVGYVTRMGRSIARVAERQDLSYQFTVLYDDRVYATQAPGGFVYVTTGFLNYLQNEAELAAVLAHEIAQLQYRDPRLSLSRKALSLLTQTGAVAAPFFGPFGVLAAGSLVLLNAVVESRTLSPERRLGLADRRSLRYLVKAGQDPQGYLDLAARFLTLDREWAPYSYDYLSTHPMTLHRYQKILAEFEEVPLGEKTFTVNRARYQEMTKGAREIYPR